MKILVKYSILAMIALAGTTLANGQTKLLPDHPETFTATAKHDAEFLIDLKEADICNITVEAAPDGPSLFPQLIDPANTVLVKERFLTDGFLFVAETSGRYHLIFRWGKFESVEDAAKDNGKQVTVRYSNKFDVPKNAVQKAVRNVNGYQARILNQPGDSGNSYLVIQKAGRLRAVMREEMQITGGLYFSDDPKEAASKKASALYRTTPDKTGDGTPDVAVEFYSGGAHCCFEVTFIELGQHVRVLPTVDTGNDRLTPIARLPRGGLRFSAAEQAFCYWTINYAQSPQPGIIWEFNRNDQLMPRFDQMRKSPPPLAKIKGDAALAKKKINLNPYISPEENFNDFEEPFWEEMLDLIYTGNEALAWRYFDLAWPAKKVGKEKFLADFKEQLALTAYGDYKKMPKPPE